MTVTVTVCAGSSRILLVRKAAVLVLWICCQLVRNDWVNVVQARNHSLNVEVEEPKVARMSSYTEDDKLQRVDYDAYDALVFNLHVRGQRR